MQGRSEIDRAAIVGDAPAATAAHDGRGGRRLAHEVLYLLSEMSGVLSDRLENTVDAMRGRPLIDRVLARKNELEDALAELGPHDVIERQAIETALASGYFLMTGDLVHPSAVVARDLNNWLERYKHVGQEITRRQQEARLAHLRRDADEQHAEALAEEHASDEAA